MKKILSVIFMTLLMTLVSSCDMLKSEVEVINEMVDKLISSLEDKDKDEFKNLFALSKINESANFEESIADIFEYYNGEFVSEKHPGLGTDQEKEGNYRAKWYNLAIDVVTDKEEYRIATYWCTEYSTDSNSLGIWSLYIINEKDYPTPDYTYRGDGLWTPGINIAKTWQED